MKRSLLYIYILFVGLLTIVSCTSDEHLQQTGETVKKLRFNCDVQYFDDSMTRSAVSFPEGAVMYLNFGSVSGTAVYKGGKWDITVPSDLPETSSGTCTVTYIENPQTSTSTVVTLSPQSCVYTTSSGTYKNTVSEMSVTAALTPLTSRVRFTGTGMGQISVKGLKYYTHFNVSSSTFTSSSDDIPLSVSSGTTPYVYSLFDDAKTLTISYDGIEYSRAYTSTSILKVGHSGYISIPTKSSHQGWTSSADGSDSSSGMENGHEYINLGLSVKWATMNVGATEVAGSKINSHTGLLDCYGEYYAWGETSPKDSYDWSNLKYCSGTTYKGPFTKYVASSTYGTIDSKAILEPSDDAAYANWGGTWRMPTKAEQDELRTNCTWMWTTMNGVKGYKVSASNGNSIFLPAAGCRSFIYFYDVGSLGGYWSRSLSTGTSNYAYELDFYPDDVFLDYYFRYYGRSIRPVCP